VTEWIDGARVALAFAGLSFAAYTDWKTREVPDGLWYALALCAIALFALDLSLRFGGDAWVLAVPVGLIFVVAVTGGEIVTVVPGDDPLPEGYEFSAAERARIRLDIALSAALIAAAVAVFVGAGGLDLGLRTSLLEGPQAQAYSVSLMFGLALLMFFTSLIAGGADAKGLMALALLFPVAPALPGLPLVHASALSVVLVPFSLAAFFNGAIILVAARLPVSPVVSWRRGELRFPDALFGVPKPVAMVNLEREWVLGVVEGGQWRPKRMPTHGSHSDEKQKEALDFLKARGDRTVFVSPKLPFMVYLLAGFVAVLVVSCPLYFVGA